MLEDGIRGYEGREAEDEEADVRLPSKGTRGQESKRTGANLCSFDN